MSGYITPPSIVTLTNSGNNNGSSALGFNLSTGGTVGNRVSYLTGLSYQATGATAATVITITISAGGNNYIFSYPISASAGTLQAPLVLNFDPPITGQGLISATATAPGAGATQAVMNIWGYML